MGASLKYTRAAVIRCEVGRGKKWQYHKYLPMVAWAIMVTRRKDTVAAEQWEMDYIGKCAELMI